MYAQLFNILGGIFYLIASFYSFGIAASDTQLFTSLRAEGEYLVFAMVGDGLWWVDAWFWLGAWAQDRKDEQNRAKLVKILTPEGQPAYSDPVVVGGAGAGKNKDRTRGRRVEGRRAAK